MEDTKKEFHFMLDEANVNEELMLIEIRNLLPSPPDITLPKFDGPPNFNPIGE